MENSNFKVQRISSNYFEIEYTEPSNDHTILELVFIKDYDKKATYLLKEFPYPDLAKIILDKFKFNHYQETTFLKKLKETIETDFEEHELQCLVHDLHNFIQDSRYIAGFNGQFYGREASIYYKMRNSRSHKLMRTEPDN